MVLSGMSTPEQVQDNTSYMKEFQPLSEEEKALLEQAADVIRRNTAIGCTGCRYCEIACPFNVPRFEWESNNPKIVKCEMCAHLIAEGGIPKCVEVCPRQAIIYGDRKGVEAIGHQTIDRLR